MQELVMTVGREDAPPSGAAPDARLAGLLELRHRAYALAVRTLVVYEKHPAKAGEASVIAARLVRR